MLGTHDLALFTATVFVLNATPGVDMMLVLASTLKRGVRTGLMTSLGVAAGCVVHTLLAAFGMAALLATSAAAFSVLKLAGAAYLVWLGLGMWRAAWRGKTASPVAATVLGRSGWQHFRDGLLTNVLNPKVALFFLAFLPQFVPAGSWSATLSFLLLGAWFVLQGTLFLLALVAVTVSLKGLVPGPGGTMRRGLQAIGGGLFIALAVRVVGTRPALA